MWFFSLVSRPVEACENVNSVMVRVCVCVCVCVHVRAGVGGVAT